MERELHSIKKFRGSNLGILKLNKLADSKQGIIVRFGGEEFLPISYDTYGHPIISEECFAYYKACKALKEREGESLVPEVEYEPQFFSIRRDAYDSKEGIESIETFPKDDQLTELKRILVYRKKAHFSGKELNTYILYGRYALYSDGRVYMCTYKEISKSKEFDIVMDLSEVSNFELLGEVHIPGPKDRCAICGKKFSIDDVKKFSTTEDENCNKVHSGCLSKYIEAVNYQTASKIVDTIYSENPSSEIIREYDEEDEKEKVWYKYHTVDGDLGIRFKNKVIEIKWYGNFKPFNLESVFEKEEVTKRRETDSKVIHAWSFNDAIRYISMVAEL